MKKGTVKWFNAEKGFGFITGEDGEDAFVHFSEIQKKGYRTLEEGETVTYETEAADKGVKAVNVTPCND